MKILGRIIKFAPLMLFPLINYRRLLADSSHQFQGIDLLDDKISQIKTQEKTEKNNLQDNQRQQIKKQQENQSQESKKVQHKQQKEIKQDKLQNIQSVQQQSNTINKQQQVLSAQHPTDFNLDQPISQNQAIISPNCPYYITQYLRRIGFKLITRNTDNIEEIIIKNKKSEVLTLNLLQTANKNQDSLKLISNFINPPQEITTIQEATQYLKTLGKDDFLVLTYIPFKQHYEQLIKSRTTSIFDNFTISRKVDLDEAEKNFNSISYNSASNRNYHAIVRQKQVADYLRLNSFNIGVPYILNKTSKQSGNESNNQWNGQRYLMNNLQKQWSNKGKQVDKDIINKKTHLYLNKIDSQCDMINKIRQIQMSGDKRKVLLFYSNQSRQDFHEQSQDILQKVAHIQRQNVIIIKTANQQLLKKIFRVQPDNFATIRLFDLSQLQPSLFQNSSSNNAFIYSRRKYQGAFKFQNICQFVNKEGEEYYESKKKLTYIKTIKPQELKKAENTLVLLQKEGCHGCKYTEQTLDELKKIIKSLSYNPKLRKNVIYKYKIQDPQNLIPIKLRRYSIFNEDFDFIPPTTTPKLYLLSHGKYLDLKVQESIGRLKTIKNESQAKQIHDIILSDIIDKIRTSQRQTFTEL